ncbi:hypothetical protein Pelo_3469 [Pelomyxa schiedti]|nr:hypothetical protein Pelo_3469 [Pelomyxa schiedti]
MLRTRTSTTAVTSSTTAAPISKTLQPLGRTTRVHFEQSRTERESGGTAAKDKGDGASGEPGVVSVSWSPDSDLASGPSPSPTPLMTPPSRKTLWDMTRDYYQTANRQRISRVCFVSEFVQNGTTKKQIDKWYEDFWAKYPESTAAVTGICLILQQYAICTIEAHHCEVTDFLHTLATTSETPALVFRNPRILEIAEGVSSRNFPKWGVVASPISPKQQFQLPENGEQTTNTTNNDYPSLVSSCVVKMLELGTELTQLHTERSTASEPWQVVLDSVVATNTSKYCELFPRAQDIERVVTCEAVLTLNNFVSTYVLPLCIDLGN